MTPPFEILFDDGAVLTRVFGEELFLAELSGPFYDIVAVRLQTEPTFSEVSHMATTLIKLATAKGCRGALGWRRGHSDAGYDLAVVGIKA
jgi:hypothetical protein